MLFYGPAIFAEIAVVAFTEMFRETTRELIMPLTVGWVIAFLQPIEVR